MAAATRGWQVRTLPSGKSVMEIIASVNTILLWSALLDRWTCVHKYLQNSDYMHKQGVKSDMWAGAENHIRNKLTLRQRSLHVDHLSVIVTYAAENSTSICVQSTTKTKTFGGAYGLCWVLTTCICIGCQLAKSSIVRYGILPVLTLRATLTKSISHEPNQFANIDRTPRIHGPNMQSSNSKHVHLSKVQAGLLFSPIWQLSKMLYKVSLRSLYSTFI